MPALNTNPWFTMWVRPRTTIRAIVQTNVKHRFIALSAIYGLPTCLQIAQNFCLISSLSFGGIVLAAIIFAVVVGVIGISVTSALLFWTGKWIGGNASFLQVRCAVSWSNVTNVATILLWAILLIHFRDQVFCDAFVQSPFTKPELLLVGGFFILQFVISVWSFILLLHAIGEVQGFSAWKALLNVVIAFLVVVAVVWVLGMIVGHI
jgi:hypothetical protein